MLTVTQNAGGQQIVASFFQVGGRALLVGAVLLRRLDAASGSLTVASRDASEGVERRLVPEPQDVEAVRFAHDGS